MKKYEKDLFGLTVLQNSHPDIRKLRRETGTPSIHGNKFWKATLLLIDYLRETPPVEGSKVLELGCGWGLGGIYCAKAFACDVTSLDADSTVFPYLLHHAQLNGVSVKPWKKRYEQVAKMHLAEFDLVIAADICFWDEMTTPLFNLLRRAHQVGNIRVVMTDPGREPFRNMAELCSEKLGAMYDNWHTAPPHASSGLVLDLAPKK